MLADEGLARRSRPMDCMEGRMRPRELSTEAGARLNAELIREYWFSFGVPVSVKVVRATDPHGGTDPVWGVRTTFPTGAPPEVKVAQ